MKKITLSFILAFITLCTQAQVLYVDVNASGGNNGSTWADAYTDLNTAITNSPAGEIWVAQGTYYPGASGVNASTFTMKNGVNILGGFNGTETAVNQRDPSFYPTILSGDLDQSGTLNVNDAYHVVTTANTNQTAIIDGFTITGGNANAGGAANSGGGILCAPSAGGGVFDPKFINCIITGNRAIQDGGGVVINSVVQASVTVGPRFYNCKFFNNQATSAGAAISSFIFQSNTSTQIENCLFYNNTAGSNGNDIYITAQSTSGCNVNITGCTFATNGANNEIMFNPDGGMSGNGLDFNNSIWYGLQFSSPVFCDGNNNCGDLTLITGANNINADPLYVNAGANDYRLQCPSPCINAGNNAFINVATGIDGGPRTQQTTVDIGAYESNYTPPVVVAHVNDDYICVGDSVYLWGTGAVSYTWDNGVTDSVYTYPAATTFYNVIGTDANGCTDTDQILVSAGAATIWINSAANYVCLGDQATISGAGMHFYSWDNGIIDGVPFNPVVTTTYHVVGTHTVTGCVKTDSITIVVQDPSAFTAGSDLNVCRSTPSFTINGANSTGGSPSWSTLGSGSWANEFTNTPEYFLSGADASATTVVLTVEIALSFCPTTYDTLILYMQDPATADAGIDLSYCADVSTGIGIMGSATGYSNTQWNSSNGGVALSQAMLTTLYDASPAEVAAGYAEIYLTVNPFSPACPQVIDTMYINFHSLPTFSLSADYTICETDSIALSAIITNGTPPFIYNWSNGATISTANTEMYMPAATGNISLYVSDSYGCSGYDTVLVTVDASETLSGTMHVGAGVLTDGTLYLYRFLPQQTAFDTMFTLPFSAGTGTFTFNSFPHGDYLIKIIPDSLLFPNLLPTYYGDAFQWDSATVINHSCVSGFTADINMIALLGGTGSGTVSGFIREDVGFGSRPGHGNDHIFVPGGPLKGIDVKLGKNPGGGIQARTTSDTTGFYEFTNLPDDTFRIYVDIPGLPMDSFYIVVVTADSTVNQNYYADSNSVFPILTPAVGLHEYASSLSSSVSLYPNPASNYTSVVFESKSQSNATIRVLDITGKQAMNIQLRNLPKAKHEYQLSFADKLQSGIYFVEVMCDGVKEVKKLVVE